MKTIKNFISLLLAIAIAASILCGCDGGSMGAGASPNQTDENSRETEVSELKPVNLQESLSDFFLAENNKNSENRISIWKWVNNDGTLYVGIYDAGGRELVTFAYTNKENGYDWIDPKIPPNLRIKCNIGYDKNLTIRDIVDTAYVAYHEVTGWHVWDVQVQVRVIINRTNHPGFKDSIYDVINEKKQYACRIPVMERQLKDTPDIKAEEEDLERAFKATLLVFADEMIVDVPANVVWAATSEQGEGIWEYRNGTYYCYN